MTSLPSPGTFFKKQFVIFTFLNKKKPKIRIKFQIKQKMWIEKYVESYNPRNERLLSLTLSLKTKSHSLNDDIRSQIHSRWTLHLRRSLMFVFRKSLTCCLFSSTTFTYFFFHVIAALFKVFQSEQNLMMMMMMITMVVVILMMSKISLELWMFEEIIIYVLCFFYLYVVANWEGTWTLSTYFYKSTSLSYRFFINKSVMEFEFLC